MYLDNNWYGHRYILSKYCQCKDKPALATIQHGWIAEQEGKKISTKRKISFAPYLSWNKNVLGLSKTGKKQKIIPIGAPFLYLDKIIKYKKKIKAKGTVLFPSHSIKKMPTHKKFVQTILKEEVTSYIEKNYKGPYTVCLFYTDFTKKNINFYKKKGWKVICCGSRSNNFFLLNVHKILSEHENVICTDFTSAFIYAMYLKKKTTLIKELKINKKIVKVAKEDYSKRLGKDVEDTIWSNLYNKFPKLFTKFEKSNKSFDFAKEQLGFKFMKSKNEIRRLLGWNNLFYIIIAKFINFLILIKYDKDIKN